MFKGCHLFLMICLMGLFSVSTAQEIKLSTQSSRAKRAYNRSVERYRQLDYQAAIGFIRKACTIDKQFAEAFLLAGDVYKDIQNIDSAVFFYLRTIELDPTTYIHVFPIVGQLFFNQGKYEQSLFYYQEYLEKLEASSRYLESAISGIEKAKFALQLKNKPVPYIPVNIGDSINSVFDEYVNVISVDDATLILTRKVPLSVTNKDRIFEEQFYVSGLIGGNWSKAIPLQIAGEKVKPGGALALSPDGKYLFFTSCYLPDGYGSCDLYFSRILSGKWQEPQNMGAVINSSKWDSQPCMSSDGKTLFFTSNRPGGHGGSDIWKAVLGNDGRWETPVNLGPVINTMADEMSPFVHYDGKTLYFSSKGHPGMGGADIFVSRQTSDGRWMEPVNLGYPINTFADEIGLVVSASGTEAFISANLPGGQGGFDIYQFDLPASGRPSPVTYMKGIVRDALTSHPLKANIELIDLSRSEISVKTFTDETTGEFLTVLPTGNDYALHVTNSGYLFFSEHISLSVPKPAFDPFTIEVWLKPITSGQTIVLNNVFFAFNRSLIEPQSEVELQRLRKLLVDNPDVKIEIIGHTDNLGSEEYNQVLSTQRAKAVFEYLVNQGIDPARLKFTGMGDSMPIASNETDEGRSINRRTEFRITQ